jgi:hypothetical protein
VAAPAHHHILHKIFSAVDRTLIRRRHALRFAAGEHNESRPQRKSGNCAGVKLHADLTQPVHRLDTIAALLLQRCGEI